MSALRKAWGNSKLDVMVIDMEDAVGGTMEAKEAGRATFVQFMNEIGQTTDRKSDVNPNIVVRINCPHTTPFGSDDLEVVRKMSHVDAILLPKTESVGNVLSVAQGVDKPLWCMIETPAGVQSADRLAALDAVDCLVFGSNDLTKELKAVLEPLERQPLLYAMGRTILAARAADKLVIDGVYMDLTTDGEPGLESTSKQGRELGFDGKSLIHPKQLDIVNKAYSPSMEEINTARKIIHAYNDATAQGKGVCVVDGKLVEALHVSAAKELLLKVRSIESRRSG